MGSLILFDLDGTLYVDNQALPGAAAALAQLRGAIQLGFITNTTTQNATHLVAKLASMGIDITADELFTPVQATWQYLSQWQTRSGRTPSVWPLVAEALQEDFAHYPVDEHSPDIVVLGDIGERWNLALINQLFQCVHQGSQLIALHKNRYWQTATGLKADIGFFVAGIEYVTSSRAIIMGKPSADFFQQALARFNCAAQASFMIGDDIDSDIGGAQAVGMRGVLVKTGKYRQHYCDASAIKPWGLIQDVTKLPQFIAQNILINPR
ncbi:MAG TPA: TIGR01458 family HAD-type hydrolase [Cellvibrionaceae bacterium]|nr:TIGR01458 family HAD-type hydrolase [Cellvibrionaceae bacterium]